MMKMLSVTAALLLCLLLAGCERAILTSADELTANRWGTVTENSNRAELFFEEDTATFRVHSESFTLTVSGIYTADDEALLIHDDETHLDYRFNYLLHGDSIELTYGDGTLVLEKK